MPSILQEKKDQKPDVEGKQSPQRGDDKLKKESDDEKGPA